MEANVMLYELRIYTILPGRMDNIRSRFADHTLGIFQRLGMKVVDFWEDAEGKSVLYYVMAYDNMEQRNQQWDTFRADAQWQEAKQASELGGPIVEKVEEVFMTRSAFFHQ